MNSLLIIVAGMSVCAIGAVGYLKKLELWGVWLVVGILLIGSQIH